MQLNQALRWRRSGPEEEKPLERKRSMLDGREDDAVRRKRFRAASPEAATATTVDFFDGLPDDLVICILCKLSSSAAAPSDLISIFLTCKRLNRLALQTVVLSRASVQSLAIRSKNWSDSSHRFLKRCADSGNLDACYMLGMIRFYCLQSRGGGASLMAKAALGSHAAALYSLAVIQFNGSGGSKSEKNLRAGVALCGRAAFLGQVDAIRELGHCLQDGYGVRKNVPQGRKFLVEANARELAAVLSSASDGGGSPWPAVHRHHPTAGTGCPLLSDFGWSVPTSEPHPANRFLVEWFLERGGAGGGGGGEELRLCSHPGCGRPETRRHEFRRCSVCGTVNYCSRACQALDWKLAHKSECVPIDRWLADVGGGGGGGGAAAPANGVGGGV